MAQTTIVGGADYNRKDNRTEISIIVAFGDKQYHNWIGEWAVSGLAITKAS